MKDNNSKLLGFNVAQAASQFRLMQHHELVSYIFRSNGVEDYLDYFNAHNPSSDIPYHNKYHTYCMALNVYEASLYYNLSIEARRALLVAALFHDYDHSGGRKTDDINVAIAANNLVDAHKQLVEIYRTQPVSDVGDHFAHLTPKELIDAIETLLITKYPYDGPPVTMLQKIIRDADLMQVYEEDADRLRQQFLGLKAEMELTRGPFTPEQWGDGCRDFNDATVWHTQWAQDKAVALDQKACTEHLRNLLIGNK